MFRSIRPAVLLVLVVAVACTDQPTEPIDAPLALQDVLAPPPAPATELSGELAANEGGPSHIDLGDYESPVYSKVTVSGLLSYQGAGGYLPGSGQIDASGVVIQNQCDLIVVVRSATGIIGGANTCPSQPRQIDSYVKFSIVNGHVDAYRTTGPPGSCWKYAAPCIHFSGSQSIKVEPQEGALILTPSKTFVAPGTMITVTAKGVWAEDSTTPVPMAGRQWSWEGSGREVGGGHTKVCAAVDGFKCFVPVYQSGHVVLEALVNGKVKTQRVWIRVEGGDSVPPDSLPHLQLACNGSTGGIQVVRGEPVVCVASLSNGSTLAGVRWNADPEDGPDIAPAIGEPGTSPGGTLSTWSGPIILGTKVKVWATPAGATEELGPVEVSIEVSPRPWNTWNVGTAEPGHPNSVAEFHLLDGAMKLPRPHISRPKQVLGFFYAAPPEFMGEPVLQAQVGPNRGWSTLEREYPIAPSVVFLHPDLFGGEWYDEQNGGVAQSSRYCEPADIARFVLLSESHEYLSSDSHLAHWNASLANLDLQGRIERVKGYNASVADLQLRATATAKQVYIDIDRREHAWDEKEYPRIAETLGCVFDFVIGDGR